MDETLPPPADSQPPLPAPRRFRGKGTSALLFESALIVASVALGFVVAEWRERVADRALASRVLRNVEAEVRANIEQLRGQIQQHKAMLDALDAAAAAPASDTGWDAITRALKGSIGALPLRQAAWEAAATSGALRVIDYEIAAVLSEIYILQGEGYGRTTQRVGEALFVPETFRRGLAEEIVRLFRWIFNELYGIETYLLETYEKHLPALQRAAGG